MWSSLASMVVGGETMSEQELEGSVITAEAGLLGAMLLLTEESIMAFVKVGTTPLPLGRSCHDDVSVGCSLTPLSPSPDSLHSLCPSGRARDSYRLEAVRVVRQVAWQRRCQSGCLRGPRRAGRCCSGKERR